MVKILDPFEDNAPLAPIVIGALPADASVSSITVPSLITNPPRFVASAAKATVGAIEKIKMGGGPARQYTFAMTNMGVKLKGILVCGTKGSRSVVLSMAVPENKWSH